jgi:membrane protease YdiL (CAAX protease family)
LRFGGLLAGNLVHGLPRWTFLAVGEEIGWRGYLLPRLIESEWPRPLLLSGMVWGAWHVPSVLWGAYPAGPNRALSAVVIVMTLTSFAFVLARLRLETGSIWPPVAAHAVWNSVILDSFDGATRSPTPWTRESGVLIALVTLLAAVWSSRGAWQVRMHPDAIPVALARGKR